MDLHMKDYLSLGNAVSGFLAIVFFFPFGYLPAFGLVILAIIFDFFDGIVARKHNAHNEFGKQLDSLSDVISFGVAPSLIVLLQHNLLIGLEFFAMLLGAVLFLNAVILRLVKYNLHSGGAVYFGLPSPLAALLLLAFGWVDWKIAFALYLILGFLMLSNFKVKKPF